MSVLLLSVAATSCKNNTKEVDATAAEPVAKSDHASEKYKIDVENSTIEWKGFKPTGPHNGTVAIESGMLTTENNNLQSGDVIIDMTTITALDVKGDKKESLDAHLKGTVKGKEGDFFNVNKYPNASFEITGITTNEVGKTILSGNLTLKDIKKNVSFPVTVSTSGNTLSLVSEPFEINRTVWGVNFGSKSVFDNLGDKFINDEIELIISVKATKA